MYHGRGGLAYAPSSAKEKQMFCAFYTHRSSNWQLLRPHVLGSRWCACKSITAILAIAAVHLQPDIHEGVPTSKTCKNGDHVFVFTHYNKAAERLEGLARQEDVEYTTQEVLLMANVLLSSPCVLCGDSKEVMIHTLHGLQLFYQ